MEHERTDAEIIAGSIETPALFEVIFRRHYQRIRAYLVRRTDPVIGEDLAASTFEVAFRRRETYDDAFDSARAWLFGIATNLLSHELRSRATHLRVLPRLIDPEDRDVGSGIDDRLAAQAAADRLRRALDDLPVVERETFMLAAVARLSYADVADALGIPIGTVRSRINRARTRLREPLGSWAAIMGTEDADDG